MHPRWPPNSETCSTAAQCALKQFSGLYVLYIHLRDIQARRDDSQRRCISLEKARCDLGPLWTHVNSKICWAKRFSSEMHVYTRLRIPWLLPWWANHRDRITCTYFDLLNWTNECKWIGHRLLPLPVKSIHPGRKIRFTWATENSELAGAIAWGSEKSSRKQSQGFLAGAGALGRCESGWE